MKTLANIDIEKYYFEMFNKSGETACRSIVKSIWKKLESRRRITEKETYDLVRSKMEKASEKYPEIFDTEPRNHIYKLVQLKAYEIYGNTFETYFGSFPI